MFTSSGYTQFVNRTIGNDFLSVLNKLQKNFLEIVEFWLTSFVSESNHIVPETRLKWSHLVELIEDFFWECVFFEFHDNSHTFFVGFVTQIRDSNNFFLFHQISNLFDKCRFIESVGNLRDIYISSSFFILFDIGYSSHNNRSTTS